MVAESSVLTTNFLAEKPTLRQSAKLYMLFLYNMITTEKIKIFNSYGGDIIEFARNRGSSDHNLISDNEWQIIDNFFQEIELINKRLATQTSIEQTLLRFKIKCDSDSFKMLTDKIECYKDFQKIAEILYQIKSYVNTNSDIVWSHFDSTEKFLADLNQDIINIENCNFVTLDKVNSEFGPTSTYQEISISNGWGDNYIKLSEKFDKLYIKLTERKTAHNGTFPKPGRSWLQKLFGS
jgi:hypothetical protein